MKLDDYVVFRNNKKTLQHTSRDTSKTPIQFMTFDTRNVVDFDNVKTEVLSSVFGEKDSIARSADALFSTENGLYMVEFKNGFFTNLEISQKANNSIMLFNFVTAKQIDYSRENMSFVLVYNKDVKTLSWEDSIALHKAICAKEGFKGFGTDKLKGFSYKAVYMIEKNDIDAFLKTI